jgi:signal transduction histidine kinase
MTEERMTEPVPSSAAGALFALTTVLGDPGDAILSLARRVRTWIVLCTQWLGVLACFVVGGYPSGRIVVSATILLGFLPVVLLVACRGGPRSDERDRYLGGLLLWTVAMQNVLVTAITGGLHSPHALVMFMAFATLYAPHGWSRRGRAVLALFCGGVLAMALAPPSWTGPLLREPWFTVAAALTTTSTFVLHARFVSALHRSATDGVRAALHARDELADQALCRARELELVGSRLSHELKNPLAAIKALVQLTHRTSSEPLIKKQLGVVEREVESLSAVLQSHLGFSRPFDRVERVEVDLGPLADSVLALLAGRAKAATVALQRRGEARATLDPRRIRGALVNLVANAIEACPPGGRVEIVIEDDGATARLSVNDTGVGMPPGVAERVGTPFFTTRERGTGLGVALARAAFEQHGGKLEYRSAPGGGTSAIGSVPHLIKTSETKVTAG